MIPPRFGLLAASLLALGLSWRRPPLRPTAGALCALSALAFAHHHHVGGVVAWLLWPAPAAALAWRVWRGSWAAAPFIGYALAAALVPVPWSSWPGAWEVARAAPFWLAPAVALLAWGSRKDEGPDPLAPLRSPPEARTEPLTRQGHEAGPLATGDAYPAPPEEPTSPASAAQASREVAAILAWSGCIDVLVGALSPSGTWDLAAPVAWATWALVGWTALRAR